MENTLAAVVDELEHLLHPTPSDSYMIRFWVQVVLNSILLIVCLIYLIATYFESRCIGKPIALLRMQRVASGRFIVVNALVLLVLFDAIAAVLMLVLRYKLYTIYYGNGTPLNKLLISVQGWSPLTLVAWAYSFGNIAAMMQIRTRDYGGPSRRAVIAYNVAFFSTLIAAFGVGLPCCILANAKMNRLIRSAQTLLDILQRTTSPGSAPASSNLQQLITLQTSISACRKSAVSWTRMVLAVAAGISCLTAISAGAAFWFVAFLSDFPNNESSEIGCRSPTLVNGFDDHEITFLGLGAMPQPNSVTLPSNSNQLSQSTRLGTGKSTKISIGSSRPQNVALKRLYKDLLLSVPVVLALSVYCMVIAVLTGIHLGDKSFAWQELMYDGVSWSSTVLIIIVVAFLHNLFKYRHCGLGVAPASHNHGPGYANAFKLSRTPHSSPRKAMFGSYPCPQDDVKEELDGNAHFEGGMKVEICTESLQIMERDSDDLSGGAMGTDAGMFDCAIATKGEEGFDWLELPSVNRSKSGRSSKNQK